MTFKQHLFELALIFAIAVCGTVFVFAFVNQQDNAPKFGAIGDATITGALTSTFATVTTSNTEILATSTGRLYAVICNSGSSAVYLAAGTAAVSGSGIYLGASGGCFEINDQNQITGAINGITTTGSSNVTVLYK